MSGGGVGGEEGLEKLERVATLAFGGEQEAGDHAVREGTRLGAGAEGDFTHDDGAAERLFGMVVGGGDPWDGEEHKKAVDVSDGDSAAEGFGLGIVEGLRGEGEEAFLEARD